MAGAPKPHATAYGAVGVQGPTIVQRGTFPGSRRICPRFVELYVPDSLEL